MTTTARGAGDSGAFAFISGSISNGASWYEDIAVVDVDAAVEDGDLMEWRFTFRTSYDTAPDLTLSTTAATLIIAQGTLATTVQIRVPYASLSAISGDYIADLASKDVAGRVRHWAHGTVTFRDEPIWSDS